MKINPGSTARRTLIFRRWTELVLYGVAGGLLSLVLFAWQAQAVLGALAQQPTWAGAVLAGSAVALLLSWVLSTEHVSPRLQALLGIRHFWSYPPLWLGGIVGAAVALVIAGLSPSVGASLDFPSNSFPLGAVLGGFAFLLCLVAWDNATRVNPWSRQAGGETDERSEDRNTLVPDLSIEKLLEWIRSDDVVYDPTGDVFNRARVARRIAERLCHTPTPAQAVVGSLGAGKTTICHLVKRELVNRGESAPRLVTVALWPFETARAAVTAVLSALIDELAQEVNVLALRGLPSAYARSMSTEGGIAHTLARASEVRPPHELLQKIDTIASAIQIRYVVWIEDIERFAGSQEASKETPTEAEKLAPIRALLFGLDQLQSVTVVTATTHLHSWFDTEKIARYVEELPELNSQFTRPLLERFRNYHISQVPIDPVRAVCYPYDARSTPPPPLDENIISALALLCSTPRTFKHALRATSETWERLAGELDFDAVFAMNVIRVSSPRTFARVRENVESLRVREVNSSEPYDWATELAATLDGLSLDMRHRRATGTVLKKFFWLSGHPQSFSRKGTVDYWHRYLSEPELALDERDQTSLSTLASGTSDNIIQLLHTSYGCDATLTFRNVIPPATILQLVMAIARWRSSVKHREPLVRNSRSDILLKVVHELWTRGAVDPDRIPLNEKFRCLREVLDVCIPKDLELATRIEGQFISAAHHGAFGRAVFGDNDRYSLELQSHRRALLEDRFADQPELLANALEGTWPETLTFLLWGRDADATTRTRALPLDGWVKFRRTLLASLSFRPECVIPQVARLFCGEGHFSPESAAHLFEDEQIILRELLKYDETLQSDDWAVKLVLARIGELRLVSSV